MGDLAMRVAVLEEENAILRERVLELEACLLGSAPPPPIFGLTALEERLFSALLHRDSLTKEQMMSVVYSHRPDADLPEAKIIDVWICKVRKKLKPFGIGIETIHGRGYRIDGPNKARFHALAAAAA